MVPVICDNMVNFFENNNALNNFQLGFGSKRSCFTNLLDFSLNIFGVYNERAVDVIYLCSESTLASHQYRGVNTANFHGFSGWGILMAWRVRSWGGISIFAGSSPDHGTVERFFPGENRR